MDEDIKLEVLKCFRKEVEEIRDELKDISREFVGIKYVSENSESSRRDLHKEVNSLSKENVALTVQQQQLEKRLVQHNTRLDTKIDNNYRDLRLDFQTMKKGVDLFQKEMRTELSDIGKTIAKWGGQGSILKILFGTVVGTVIGGVVVGTFLKAMAP